MGAGGLGNRREVPRQGVDCSFKMLGCEHEQRNGVIAGGKRGPQETFAAFFFPLK